MCKNYIYLLTYLFNALQQKEIDAQFARMCGTTHVIFFKRRLHYYRSLRLLIARNELSVDL